MEEEKEKVDLEKKSGKKEKKSKKDKKEKEKKKEKSEKKEKDKKDKKSKKDKKGKQEEQIEELSVNSYELIKSEKYAKAVKDQEIMVSVLVVTYNQENFIGQTLTGIVEQKTNFGFEVLVGDDASTDGTPNVVQKYAKRYPHIFRVCRREKNLGPVQNWLDIVKKARGKYIATVEGDDFWCNKKKLQMQVDFLEAHPEYSACGTGYRYVDINGKEIPLDVLPLWTKREFSFACECKKPFVFTLNDYNDCRMPSQASTLLGHNFFLESDFSHFYQSMRNIGDHIHILLLLKRGNIYVMPEKTSCYRFVINGSNNFVSMVQSNPFHFYNWFKGLMYLQKYAKINLGLDVTREAFVKNAVFQIVDSFRQHPTKGRWSVLWGMLRIANKKRHVLWMILKSIYLSCTAPVVRNLYPLDKKDDIYQKVHRTWDDFRRDLRGRKLVLYGAGGGGRDVLNEYYDQLPVERLVDSNEDRANTWFMGYMVWKPEEIWKMDRENTVVLITTAYFYKDIINSLEEHGFHHYYVYPIMDRRRWYNKPLDWLQDYIKDIR